MSNVATPVVARVVQYDASWTFLQNGGLMKLPAAPGLSLSLETQNEMRPDVTIKLLTPATAEKAKDLAY